MKNVYILLLSIFICICSPVVAAGKLGRVLPDSFLKEYLKKGNIPDDSERIPDRSLKKNVKVISEKSPSTEVAGEPNKSIQPTAKAAAD